jgi:hypothetical protein
VSNDERDGYGNTKDEEKVKLEIDPLEHILRLLMTVQNVSGSYTRNEGMMLPGFGPRAKVGGFDENFEAPGLPFLLGHQNTNLAGENIWNFPEEAATNGWLLAAPYLNPSRRRSRRSSTAVRTSSPSST